MSKAYSYDDEIRSLPQNARFHSMVRDIARQVQWAGGYMDEEDWKRILLAAKYGQRVIPNPLDPHAAFIVVNTRRSSGLVKPEMAELIGEIEAFGADRGVKWSEDE